VNDADVWMSVRDVADLMKVSERTVGRWTRLPSGRLLAFKIGEVTRIRRVVLDAWIKSRERATA
jgi:excisionase family DNA binding protein